MEYINITSDQSPSTTNNQSSQKRIIFVLASILVVFIIVAAVTLDRSQNQPSENSLNLDHVQITDSDLDALANKQNITISDKNFNWDMIKIGDDEYETLYQKVEGFIPASFDLRYTAEGKKCDWTAQEEFLCAAGNWAFTLTQTIRNVNCYKGGNIGELSAQQLIDCTSKGSNTCASFTNITTLNNALDFIVKEGVGLSATYPYQKLDGAPGNCIPPSVDYFTNVTGSNDLQAIMTNIINNGPVTMILNYYTSFTRNNVVNQVYAHTNPDFPLGLRAVQIVGWGTDSSNNKYWIVSNTFGKLWGNNGYTNIYQTDSYIAGYYMFTNPTKGI